MAPLRTGGDWTGELRATGLLVVAQVLGLEQRRGRSLAPCPACGAERRGRADRRGPIGLRRDLLGWECHRCRARGDAVALASWARMGKASPPAGRWSELRVWAAAAGLIGARRARPVLRAVAEPEGLYWRRPPRVEVDALWNTSRPVDGDPAAVVWLEAREIDASRVAALDLARVIGRGAATPKWARHLGRRWSQSHRLLVPLFEADGAFQSLHARSLEALAPGGQDKAGSPAGFDVAGLIMANEAGVGLLRHRRPTSVVVVTEGVPDFLSWCAAGQEMRPVFGVMSGSWSAELAARLSLSARVEVRTHEDGPGEHYADEIKRTLGAQVEVARLSPAIER